MVVPGSGCHWKRTRRRGVRHRYVSRIVYVAWRNSILVYDSCNKKLYYLISCLSLVSQFGLFCYKKRCHDEKEPRGSTSCYFLLIRLIQTLMFISLRPQMAQAAIILIIPPLYYHYFSSREDTDTLCKVGQIKMLFPARYFQIKSKNLNCLFYLLIRSGKNAKV